MIGKDTTLCKSVELRNVIPITQNCIKMLINIILLHYYIESSKVVIEIIIMCIVAVYMFERARDPLTIKFEYACRPIFRKSGKCWRHLMHIKLNTTELIVLIFWGVTKTISNHMNEPVISCNQYPLFMTYLVTMKR